MKKGIIIAIAALTWVLSLNNTYYDMFSGSTASYEEPAGESDSSASSEAAQQAGIVYINEDMDFYIVVNATGWTYQSDGYIVSFFDSSSEVNYGTFSFLSLINTLTDSEKEAKTGEFFEDAKDNLVSIFGGLTCEQIDKYYFGEYCAYRHHFEGGYGEGDMITVENLYWWVGDRQYTCSLFCNSDVYDEFAEVLYSALETFSPVSQLG